MGWSVHRSLATDRSIIQGRLRCSQSFFYRVTKSICLFKRSSASWPAAEEQINCSYGHVKLLCYVSTRTGVHSGFNICPGFISEGDSFFLSVSLCECSDPLPVRVTAKCLLFPEFAHSTHNHWTRYEGYVAWDENVIFCIIPRRPQDAFRRFSQWGQATSKYTVKVYSFMTHFCAVSIRRPTGFR